MNHKYLDRKTVLNIVYTQQATRMADAYETLLTEFEAFMTTPTSRLLRAKQAENVVLAIENDSLKAEKDAETKATFEAIRTITQLRDEVERLNNLANDPYRLSKGWRPIETAPMDGTDILCFCVEPEFEGEENPHTEQRVCFFGQMQEDYSCWMSHYGYEQRPTHWMPLPNSPIK